MFNEIALFCGDACLKEN